MRPKRKKTILFIEFYPYSGSVNGLLAQIAYFNTHHTFEYECIVAGSSGSLLQQNTRKLSYTFYAIDAISLKDIHDHPLHVGKRYVSALFRLAFIAMRHRIDMIHCNHYEWSPYATPIGFLSHIPVVIHLKDIYMLQPKIARILMKWYKKTTFIAVSNHTKKVFAEQFNVDTDKITVIHDGIEDTVFTPLSQKQILEKVRSERKTIIMMSRPAPERDIEVFIDAAALLFKHKNLYFEYYGLGRHDDKNPYVRSLYARVYSLGIQKRFKFLPFEMNSFSVARVFHKSFLSLVPARQFALPNVAIESLMCSVPVVAADIGGNAEIIHSAQVGELVSSNSPLLFAKAVEKYLKKPAVYISTASVAPSAMVKKFSALKQYEKIVTLYKTLI